MNKAIFVNIAAVLFAFYVLLTGCLDTAPEPTHRDFYRAIAKVESNNRDTAIGAHGELGRYQITRAYWQDAVEYSNIGGDFADCIESSYSKLVIEAYMRRYANKAWYSFDFYTLARVHHGGWNGLNRPHTIKYADKVIKEIK